MTAVTQAQWDQHAEAWLHPSNQLDVRRAIMVRDVVVRDLTGLGFMPRDLTGLRLDRPRGAAPTLTMEGVDYNWPTRLSYARADEFAALRVRVEATSPEQLTLFPL